MEDLTQKTFKKIGWEAQKILSPLHRKQYSESEIANLKPTAAAVLCLLYKKNNQWHIPLIVRQDYKGHHANQISFPGGKVEPQDQNLAQTAVRETHEEIGVKLLSTDVLQPLTKLYIPPSNFIVSPFISVINRECNFVKEEKEVQKILEIPFAELLNTKIQTTQITNYKVPCFILYDQIIWGATAMMLNEVKEIINSLYLSAQ